MHIAWLFMRITRRRSLLLTSLFSIAVLAPAASWAQTVTPTLVIQSTLPGHAATNIPVDEMSRGFRFNHVVQSGSDPLVCLPITSSINHQTVILLETGTSNRHPLYTGSWTDRIQVDASLPNYSRGQFSLSISQPGYQLKPVTWYEVQLLGGAEGLAFTCRNHDSSTTLTAHLANASYKYTFKTGPDTIAPIIANPQAAASLNNAQVWWSGGESTTGKVEYGLSTSYGQTVATGTAIDHKAQLTGLEPGKTYFYRITSTDTSGNASTKTGSFSTWSMGSIKVAEVTGHEASIIWTTSVPTDSMVEYGPGTNYSQRSGSKDLRTDHNVRLVNLKSNTAYSFRIKSSNSAGVAVTSNLTFATRDALAGPAPNAIEFPANVIGISDEWSRYNLKDFPDDVLADFDDEAEESSEGAVLASLDNQSPIVSYVKKGVSAAEERWGWWVVWIVFPILLLLIVVGFYLYYKHDVRMNGWKLEMKEVEVKNQRS